MTKDRYTDMNFRELILMYKAVKSYETGQEGSLTRERMLKRIKEAAKDRGISLHELRGSNGGFNP